MAERKYIKLKVNMYEDTKSKIIDMKPERDLIHCIWTRFITLAGKVNLEGKLYMSKNIPYTIETLAIEFNRGAYQVKLALDVFMELEMIELTEDNVYIVKNFVKHQNIKVKETIKPKDKEEDIKIKEVEVKENLKNKIYDNQDNQSENKISQIYDDNVEASKNKTSKNKLKTVKDNKCDNKESENTDISKIDKKNSKDIGNTVCEGKINKNLQGNMPIVLEEKKNNKKANKSKSNNKSSKNIDEIEMDEENEENSLIQFYDGDEGRPLKQGEYVTKAWSF